MILIRYFVFSISISLPLPQHLFFCLSLNMSLFSVSPPLYSYCLPLWFSWLLIVSPIKGKVWIYSSKKSISPFGISGFPSFIVVCIVFLLFLLSPRPFNPLYLLESTESSEYSITRILLMPSINLALLLAHRTTTTRKPTICILIGPRGTWLGKVQKCRKPATATTNKNIVLTCWLWNCRWIVC